MEKNSLFVWASAISDATGLGGGALIVLLIIALAAVLAVGYVFNRSRGRRRP